MHEVQGAGLPGYTDQSLAADLDVVPGDLSGLMGTLGGQLPTRARRPCCAPAPAPRWPTVR